MNMNIILFDDDGEEETHTLPCKMEVCYDCEGTGFVMNESMRHHAYTQEEFYDTFHDDEDREEYFKRGGIYDVQCPTCKGANVVKEVDREVCNRNEKLKVILERWDKQVEAEYQAESDMRAEMRMERMMCGDY